MGKGKNSSTTTKKTTEKRALEVPEMAIAAQIWLAPSTKAKHLKRLREQGYLPD